MNANQPAGWRDLIEKHLDGLASDQEVAELSDQLERCAETRALYLKLQQVHAFLILREYSIPSSSETSLQDTARIPVVEHIDQESSTRWRQIAFAIVGLFLLGMLISRSFLTVSDATIVEITSLQGDVQWTGNDGQVIEHLEAGQALTGGTLETRSLESSAEFLFKDGSTIATAGGSVLTFSDRGRKEIHLRSGVLSANVEKQPADQPMLVVTPAARLEILGTRFDVVANPEASKVSVRHGRVRATRLSDGKMVEISDGQSAIASSDTQTPFSSRNSNQFIHSWSANLERDCKQGEGRFISAMSALRTEIRLALKDGQITRDQIPEVYGTRLAELSDTEGVLRGQTKHIKSPEFGNLIQVVTLYIQRNQTDSVVLTDESVLRIRGCLSRPAEIHVGLGAFGTSRATAGRFLTTARANGAFDWSIPIRQFQPFRGRTSETSPVGMEVFSCFCFIADPTATLDISSVEIDTPAQ